MISKYQFCLVQVVAILLIATLSFGGVSYAGRLVPESKESLGGSLAVESDPYKDELNICAPVWWAEPFSKPSSQYTTNAVIAYSLRYTEFPAGHFTIRLFFSYFSYNWCFIKTAVDINGDKPKLYFIGRRKIRFVNIDERFAPNLTISEDRAETFAITLSKEYLDAHKDSGIKLRTYGGRCNVDLEIPGHYIQKFLHKIKSRGGKGSRSPLSFLD